MGLFAKQALDFTITRDRYILQCSPQNIAPHHRKKKATIRCIVQCTLNRKATDNCQLATGLFLGRIDYFAMTVDVQHSESDRRALAAANPERMMGTRQNLSARNDVQDLIDEMYTASCGLQCQTAPVHHYVIKLNEECKELFQESLLRDYIRHVPLTTGLSSQRRS